jgi:glucuronate isomerase
MAAVAGRCESDARKNNTTETPVDGASAKLFRLTASRSPPDNALFGGLPGSFQDGVIPGKIQWGSGWWFMDQERGMRDQMNMLSDLGLLSRFVGMVTDSRSFLSCPRHEYFRRILCDLLGADVESGRLPDRRDWLDTLVADVCCRNARALFDGGA